MSATRESYGNPYAKHNGKRVRLTFNPYGNKSFVVEGTLNTHDYRNMVQVGPETVGIALIEKIEFLESEEVKS
jgi:hypothetical protein